MYIIYIYIIYIIYIYIYIYYIHHTQSSLISQRQDGHNTYICNHENNCPLGYQHNSFVATHALGHVVCS